MKKYTREGIEIVECATCHSDVYITKVGVFRGNWYCDAHYLIRLEQQINEWKMEYKRWRNGMKSVTKTDIMEAPRQSEYIN